MSVSAPRADSTPKKRRPLVKPPSFAQRQASPPDTDRDTIEAARMRRQEADANLNLIAALTEKAGLSEIEHDVIIKHARGLDVYDECAFLEAVVDALRECIEIAAILRRKVDTRERILKLLWGDMKLYESGEITQEEVVKRIAVTAPILQSASVDVVEGVAHWRKMFMIPQPLVYDGWHYLLAMLEFGMHWTDTWSSLPSPFELNSPLTISGAYKNEVQAAGKHLQHRKGAVVDEPRDPLERTLARSAMFLHTIATDCSGASVKMNDRINKATSAVVERGRVKDCERILRDEYAAQLDVLKQRVALCERGAFVPLLRVVYDCVGPTELAFHHQATETRFYKGHLRTFARHYTREEKQELGIPVPEYHAPSKLPAFLAYSGHSNETKLLCVNTFKFMLGVFGTWDMFVARKARHRAVVEHLLEVSGVRLLQERFACWRHYSRLVTQSRSHVASSIIAEATHSLVKGPKCFTVACTQTERKKKKKQ